MKFENLTQPWSSLLPILIGAILGAALGYFGQCSSGTCPLTSTWWRGAIYGCVLGLLFTLTSGSSPENKARSSADRAVPEDPLSGQNP